MHHSQAYCLHSASGRTLQFLHGFCETRRDGLEGASGLQDGLGLASSDALYQAVEYETVDGGELLTQVRGASGVECAQQLAHDVLRLGGDGDALGEALGVEVASGAVHV